MGRYCQVFSENSGTPNQPPTPIPQLHQVLKETGVDLGVFQKAPIERKQGIYQ